MNLFASNGADLYYEIYGAKDAAHTVVLLHGVGGNHASWFNQVAAWREKYHLVVPDARGFGNSGDPDGVGRSAFLEDLELILETEGICRCILIGQSMGGGTAIDYACTHPERVEALILADTLFGIALPPGLSEEMAMVAEKTSRYSQQERVLGQRFRVSKPELSVLYTALASFNRVNVRTLSGKQEEHDLDKLSSIDIPILFLVGQEDVLFPSEVVRKVHEQVRGSEFIELSDAGHSVYFESPDRFNKTVETWLDRVLIE